MHGNPKIHGQVIMKSVVGCINFYILCKKTGGLALSSLKTTCPSDRVMLYVNCCVLSVQLWTLFKTGFAERSRDK